MRRACAQFLILSLMMQGWGWADTQPEESEIGAADAPSAGPVAADELETAVRQLAERARELRPQLDRSQFDLDALLERLDYDPERIAAFVTEEIALEVYPGVLRGALGTLLARAGNSLDQALLLATLLKDTGQDAVIRRGTLSATQARSLLLEMAARDSSTASPWHSPMPNPSSDWGDDLEAAETHTAMLRQARSRSQSLVKALEGAGVELSRSLENLVEQARAYYWVDARADSEDPWGAIHPAAGSTLDVDAEDTFEGEVPAELAHRVTFEVVVDRRLGGRVEEAALMRPVERMSASLVGQPIVLTLVPDQFLRGENSFDVDAIAERTRFLFPLLDGAPAPGAQALSLSGLTLPMDALAMGAAGFFDVISGTIIRGVDAIAGLGVPDSEQETQVGLEAIRLRMTFDSPTGDSRVTERDLFHWQRDLGGEPRTSVSDSVLVRALARVHTLVAATGSHAPAYLIDGLLAEAVSPESLFEAGAEIDESECDTLACLHELEWPATDSDASLALVYAAFDTVFRNTDSLLVYRNAPSLLAFHAPLFPSGSRDFGTIDIIANRRVSLRVEDGQLRAAPEESVFAGVWDTWVEEGLAEAGRSPEPARPSQGESWRTIRREAVEPKAGSSPVARAMLRDLDEGYLILADASFDLDQASSDSRWWRVDPETGNTLGMTSQGGAITLEYVAGLLMVAVAAAAASVATISKCISAGYSGPACLACANVVSGSFLLATALVRTLFYGGMSSLDPIGFYGLEGDDLFKRCLRVNS